MAANEITAAGLAVTISYEPRVSECYVVNQYPNAGDTVDVGSTVHLVVAQLVGPFCEFV